jgi:hypothetical protein
LVLGVLLVPLASTASPADLATCARVDRIVVVRISEARYPKTADHVDDAIRAGQPRRLTLDRRGAAQRREDALQGIATRRGYDRDEYPPAESRQGGKGADVRYVPSADTAVLARRRATSCVPTATASASELPPQDGDAHAE